MPSQLFMTFFNAVAAFNSCQKVGNYAANLGPFLDPHVIVEEENPPNTRHVGRDAALRYMDETQPRLLPRFCPDFSQFSETPSDSDNATFAWVSGPGWYQDQSADPPSQPVAVRYFFQFRRATTGDDWLITIASACGANA